MRPRASSEDLREPAGGARLPSLDVVVPTLDEEELLPRLLERLLGASDAADRPARAIVSDGGSRDRTRALAGAAGARVVTGSRGRGAQLARGAAECRADVLLFLHADCLPEPGALARVRAAFAAPELVVAGMEQRIEADGLFFRAVERWADARVRRGVVFGDSGLAVRRADYLACGGFGDEPLFEDVELCRRLARAGRLRGPGRAALVRGARIRVSARRWVQRGAFRVTVRNACLKLAFGLGARPALLARFYGGALSAASEPPAPRAQGESRATTRGER